MPFVFQLEFGTISHQRPTEIYWHTFVTPSNVKIGLEVPKAIKKNLKAERGIVK